MNPRRGTIGLVLNELGPALPGNTDMGTGAELF